MMQEKNDLRDKKQIVQFLFVGRLVREKGFDRVIAVAKNILSHAWSRATLGIYGDGGLRASMITQLSVLPGFLDASQWALPQWGEKVVYFGHKSPAVIKQALLWAHYMLMPSRFLETFGLSALEAISYGVPVIGYKKGGLSQFLLSEHALPDSGDDVLGGEWFVSMVEGIIAKFSWLDWRRQSHTARDIASRYTPERWSEELMALLDGPRRILLVTDYLAPIGGIETHVATIADLLRKAGCEVETFAAVNSHPSKLKRIIWLLTSLYDPFVRSRLREKVRNFSPEVVWCHSVARAIGPTALAALDETDAFKIKTYHDLGYFGPYATGFEHEAELDSPKSFREFYRKAPLLDKVFPFYLAVKYSKLARLSRILRTFDLHIVPSQFMENAVRAFLDDNEADVRTIPHAISLWTP